LGLSLHAAARTLPDPSGAGLRLGVAAMVALLHLAVLAGRLRSQSAPGRPVAGLMWQLPRAEQVSTALRRERVPSNPLQSFSAGRLALAAGMAVLALANWLHITRVHGSHAD
jgi:hypothetical protein